MGSRTRSASATGVRARLHPTAAAAVWQGLVGPLGPGSSALVLGTAGLVATAVAARTRHDGAWPAAVMAVVAFDLAGGLVAFQFPATRDSYAHSSRIARLGFAAAHVQAFAVPLVSQGTWASAARRYLSAMGASALLESALPDSPKRRVAGQALALALSAADVVLASGEKQRWLGPVILLKVVGGHASIPHPR